MATANGVCWTGTPGTSPDLGFAWVKRKMQIERVVEDKKASPLEKAVDELARYMTGERLQFSCPLDMRGTVFQLAVWQELLRIPSGETRTYLDIARAIDRPAAVRAVGAANGANPIAVIVPCHRVIGSNGALTGYGGGLPAKKWLLALEKASRS
jgi:O-6-methylguanine DNA methyltransferase